MFTYDKSFLHFSVNSSLCIIFRYHHGQYQVHSFYSLSYMIYGKVQIENRCDDFLY